MAKEVLKFEEYKPKKNYKGLLLILIIPIILFVLVIGSRIGIYYFTGQDYFYAINEKLASFPMFVDSKVEVKDTYFYNQLTDEEKIIYRNLYQACLNQKGSVMIYHHVDYEQIERAKKALCAYYPEFYCLNYGMTYQQNTFGFTLIEFSTLIESFPDLNNLVTVLKQDNNYDTLLAIHDFIITQLTYKVDCAYSQDYRSALYNKEAVCAGYASLFQMLAKDCDIECYYIEGDAIQNGSVNGHAWNLVGLNGKYYYIDSTWDDSSLEYDFFLVDDDIMLKSHVNDDDFDYPNTSGDMVFEAYIQKGEIAVKELDIDNLCNAIIHKLETTSMVTVHFVDTQDCDTVYKYLFDNKAEKIKEMVQSFNSDFTNISYSRLNDCIKIEVK